MANTINTTIAFADGWTAVSTNPSALSITANNDGYWYVAISESGFPTVTGEKMDTRGSYVTGSVTGTVYVRVEDARADQFYSDIGIDFGITEEA